MRKVAPIQSKSAITNYICIFLVYLLNFFTGEVKKWGRGKKNGGGDRMEIDQTDKTGQDLVIKGTVT